MIVKTRTQFEFANQDEAVKKAQELFKTHPRVKVILSLETYFVETRTSMIRSWERVILSLPEEV